MVASMLCILVCLVSFSFALGTHLSAGFHPQQVNYQIQKPYNIDVKDRYSFQDCIHRLWVFNSDKPLSPGSPTRPRTELRFVGHDYTRGVWQFEADFYVPSGTTGVSIMQVFGGKGLGATALMLRVYSGNLVRYGGGLPSATVADDIYDKWIHLNVIHDADAKKIQIYLDWKLVREEDNDSYKTHYFKCGVYTQNNSSYLMESRWKNIKIWKK